MPRAAALSPEELPLPRVLIVDDSAVARAVMAQLIEASGRFTVAGALPHAAAALAFLRAAPVELVLLDIAMPGVDGLTALPDLLAACPSARVVVVSSAAQTGAAATVEALALGAADTLVKPTEVGGGSARFRAELLARLDRLAGLSDQPGGDAAAGPVAGAVARETEAFAAVAIGASTGGIHALGQLLGALPARLRAPILVTQHLPASFMPYFAAQLAVLAKRPAEVAADRVRVRPGRIIVAPGDAHLRLVALPDGDAAVRLTREPQPSGCTPSADPMLASLAEVYGTRGLGVLLSGMGRDGAEGAHAIREAGGTVFAQDRESSVVWGMPGAVAPFADAVRPPAGLAALIAAGRRS